MKYAVGLGNPGKRYINTRHNLGWWVLDSVGDRVGFGAERERWTSLITRVPGRELTLVKPLTWMNASGRAVAAMIHETSAELENVLIIMDDLALPVGTLRLRTGGSSGGHRGLQSVLDALGTEEVPRMRLGIGPCPPEQDSRDFVLSPFSDSQYETVEQMVAHGVDAVLCWLEQSIESCMSRYNGTVETDEN
ncbi:MAG: aminoacyl-tRNA hydrolase [Candidatus Brocadiia bacterium]